MQLPDVAQQSTAAVKCQPRQPEVWWNEELALNLPRSVLSRDNVFLQLSLREESSGVVLAVSKRSLAELVRQSVRSRSWELLDQDWEWRAPGDEEDDEEEEETDKEEGEKDKAEKKASSEFAAPPPAAAALQLASAFTPEQSAAKRRLAAQPPRRLGRCRARLVVVDLVSAFDELMLHGRQEAGTVMTLCDEIEEMEEEREEAAREADGLRLQMAQQLAAFREREKQLGIEHAAATEKAVADALAQMRSRKGLKSVGIQTIADKKEGEGSEGGGGGGGEAGGGGGGPKEPPSLPLTSCSRRTKRVSSSILRRRSPSSKRYYRRSERS